MTDQERMAQWLIGNQNLKGSEQYETVANALRTGQSNPYSTNQNNSGYRPSNTNNFKGKSNSDPTIIAVPKNVYNAAARGVDKVKATGNLFSSSAAMSDYRRSQGSKQDILKDMFNSSFGTPYGMQWDDSWNTPQDVFNGIQDDANRIGVASLVNSQIVNFTDRYNSMAEEWDKDQLDSGGGKLDTALDRFQNFKTNLETAAARPRSDMGSNWTENVLGKNQKEDANDAEGLRGFWNGTKTFWRSIGEDPAGAAAFIAETAIESGPVLGVSALTTLLTKSPVMGTMVMATGAVSQEAGSTAMAYLEEQGVPMNTREEALAVLQNHELMAEANRKGFGKGLVVAAFEVMGQAAVARTYYKANKKAVSPDLLGKVVAKTKTGTTSTVQQAFTGGAGEAASLYAIGEPIEAADVWIEALAEAGTAPVEAVIAGAKAAKSGIWKTEAKSVEQQITRQRAAKRMDAIAKRESLKPTDVSSDAKEIIKRAKQEILNEARGMLDNQTDMGKALNRLLKPPANANAELAAEYQALNNILKGKTLKNISEVFITPEIVATAQRLMGHTAEGQKIIDLMQESNEISRFYNEGELIGGVSKFTEGLNPISSGSYTARMGKVWGSAAQIAGHALTGGVYILPQIGLYTGGRAIDALRAGPFNKGTKRSRLDTFIRKYGKDKYNDPTKPQLSILTQMENAQDRQFINELNEENIKAEIKEFEEAARIKAEEEAKAARVAANLRKIQNNADPIPGSPRYRMETAIRMDRSGVATILRIIKRLNPPQNIVTAIQDYENSIALGDAAPNTEGPRTDGFPQVRNLNDLMAEVTAFLNNNPQFKRLQTENGPILTPGQPQLESPQYQRGIEDNKKFLERLVEKANNDTSISEEFKGALEDAQANLGLSLGNDAVASATIIINNAEKIGVPKTITNKYLKPYLDRITRQAINNKQRITPRTPLEQAQNLTKPPKTFNEMLDDRAKQLETPETAQFDDDGNEIIDQSFDYRILPIPNDKSYIAKAARFDIDPEVFDGKKTGTQGRYIDRDTGEDHTGKTFMGANINTIKGRGSMETSDAVFEGEINFKDRKAGHTYKTNLIQNNKKNPRLWQWVNNDTNEITHTQSLVSVDGKNIDGKGSKHYYTFDYQIETPVLLHAAPTAGPGSKEKSVVLKPKAKGQLVLGDKLGMVKVPGGGIHPVYKSIKLAPVNQEVETTLNREEFMPFDGPALNTMPTNIDILPNENEVSSMRDGTYTPEVKRSKEDAAQVLQNLWEEKTGRTEPFEYTDENVNVISEIMMTEAINNLESDGNAIGWYDAKIKAAKEVLSLVEPRIKQSEDAEAAFDFALAVTSNGQAVENNFAMAVEVFRSFMDNGVMPTKYNKGGNRRGAMNNAFKFYNAYQSSGIEVPIQTFMDKNFTVNELKQYINAFNKEYKTTIKVPSSESVNTQVKGSYILGPKIGQGFYQNIRGNYEPLTMDLWWMRMWNRMVGRPYVKPKTEAAMKATRDKISTLVKKPSKVERKLINDTLKTMGETTKGLYRDPVRMDAFIKQLDKRWNAYFRQYQVENGKNPAKSQMFKSTGTYVKNSSPELQAQPTGPDRPYMRRVVERTREKLMHRQIHINTADFQALMWYPEKLLFRKLGVAPGNGSDTDYLDAAKILARKEGISDDTINQTLSNTGRDGVNDSGPDTASLDARVPRGPDGTGDTTNVNQQLPALQLQPPGGLDAGPAATIAPDARSVKEFVQPLKDGVNIGLKGSRYEDGISTLEEVLELAKILNITFQVVTKMKKGASGMYTAKVRQSMLKTDEDGNPRRNYLGAKIRVLKSGSVIDGKEIMPVDQLITAVHELAHGLAHENSLRDFEGNQRYKTKVNPVAAGKAALATVNLGSFEEVVLDAARNDSETDKAMMEELFNLQDNIDITIARNPELGSRPVRNLKEMVKEVTSQPGWDSKGIRASQFKTGVRKHKLEYLRSISELAVDPVWVYLINPKLMKKVAPVTAKAIQKAFNTVGGNNPVKFFSHPITTIMAIVAATLAGGGSEEEQQQQVPMMPPPGALNMQGALSA